MKSSFLIFTLSIFSLCSAHFNLDVASSSFYLSVNSSLIVTRALPTGTCNADTPCPIAACCGKNGLCGFSPSECGQGNCTSKCDSKADCGQYAVPGKQKCPLNVCCSQFGYVEAIRLCLPDQDIPYRLTDIASVVLRMTSVMLAVSKALEVAGLPTVLHVEAEVAVLVRGTSGTMNHGRIHGSVRTWPPRI
jgi:hypothetical protein